MSPVGWLMAAMGAVMLIGGLVLLIHTRWFLRRAADAVGTVVELAGPTGRNSQAVKSVVHFPATDGMVYEFVANIARWPPKEQVGDTLPVKYDPANPAKGPQVDQPLRLYFATGLFGTLGTFFIVLGLGIALVIG